MSDVIVFACSKGGAGKTTSAILLASELSAVNQSVVVIDADPNQHIKVWADNGLPNKVEVIGGVNEENIIDEIESAKKRARFVIVDIEGSKNMCVSYAISRADLVIIPAQPSTLDIHEAADTVRLVKQQEKAFNINIPFRLVLTKTSSAIRSKGTKEIEGDIQAHNIPRLECELIERDAFKAIFKQGRGLRDMQANAKTAKAKEQLQKAIQNAEAYAVEVVKTIKTEQNKVKGEAVA